jgi:hypothetical protein
MSKIKFPKCPKCKGVVHDFKLSWTKITGFCTCGKIFFVDTLVKKEQTKKKK